VKIIPLFGNPKTYACRSYLVLGEWNRLGDVNTLIDTGSDGSIIEEIEKASTGVGKNPVDQVILTHNHFDHAGGITAIKKRFHPRVFAFSEREGVDELVGDGRQLQIADSVCEVIHTPGHSNDSICLYCRREKVLFSGDTAVRVYGRNGTYTPEFALALKRLATLDVVSIYGGHDNPVLSGGADLLRKSLENVKR
jgi:glyoxylase-like metal-dependent hydrolase (beta-lactamase superfamily II)